MLNEIVVAVVGKFSKPGSEADKNGMENVYLTPIAGKMPNRAMVVAGTVAERAGLKIGSTLMVLIGERAADPVYGRQFNHTVLGEVKPQEILGLRKELGSALVIDVTDGAAANGAGNILEGQPANNAHPAAATPSKVDLQSGLEEAVVVTPAAAEEVEP